MVTLNCCSRACTPQIDLFQTKKVLNNMASVVNIHAHLELSAHFSQSASAYMGLAGGAGICLTV